MVAAEVAFEDRELGKGVAGERLENGRVAADA
jgi:hypothetical protein